MKIDETTVPLNKINLIVWSLKFQDQYTGLKKVFQRTFTLLKLMARNNKLVQGRLFDRLDLLLSTEGAGEELAECITEVKGGSECWRGGVMLNNR